MTTANPSTASEEGIDPSRMPRIAAYATLGVGVAAAGLTLGLFGSRAAASVLWGAAAGGLNFWALGWIVRGFLAANAGVRPLMVLVPAKLVFLFGGIHLLVKFGLADILPLLAGYALLPIGVALAHLEPARALSKG
jgi:hypothetical protein